MPCVRYANGFVCMPTIKERRVRVMKCPTCKRRRRFYCWFQEWYGWHMTCTGCGEQWQDGEMCPRPFAPRWRKENISRAKSNIKEMGLWSRKKSSCVTKK